MLPLALALLVAAGQEHHAAPSPADQQKVLRAVTGFAHDYIQRLPDFTCVRVTQHYQADRGTSGWRLQTKVAEELSYYRRQEHYSVVAVDDVPKKKIPLAVRAVGFFNSSGNFGSQLSEIFEPTSHAEFQWKEWALLRGRWAHVFSYRVPKAWSHARSIRCTSWLLFTSCKGVNYAYHGEVYVGEDTLEIMRITHVPEDVPAPFPSAIESVEYGRTAVAGNDYLLPIADETETTSGKKLFRNQSTYQSYRKFVTESALRAEIGTPSAPASRPAADARKSGGTIEAGDYFELRDRLYRGDAPSSARGTVDAAFNRPARAEKELAAVIRSRGDEQEIAVAHAMLASLYARAGDARRALPHFEHALAAEHGMPASVHSRLAALARYPAQSVAARGYSRLRHERKEDSIAVPLAVNGRTAIFTIDTGAPVSVIAESLARFLGIAIRDETFSGLDANGLPLPCRVGIAGELQAGRYRVRNVSFCVLPDQQAGFAEVAERERAILGLPVLLAFETIRWNRDGDFEIGVPPAAGTLDQANLCFDGESLVAAITLGEERANFELDTGNGDRTVLFPDENGEPAGPKEKYPTQGLGESVEVDVVRVAELKLRIGGWNTILRDVPRRLQPRPYGCQACRGNAGLDLLRQARTVTLNFKAMRLTLEN